MGLTYKNDSVQQNKIILNLHEKDLYSGSLILINKDNEFRKNEENLVPIDSEYLSIYKDSPIYINKIMKDSLLNLIDDIDGRKKILAVSGFRGEEEQKKIYNDSIDENGIEFTKKYVAKPKQSEHQTGLAIDLGEVSDSVDFICPSFPDYGICKKFKDLASSYGFIMRYAKEKEHITYISEEKWHFRYVGNPHAKIISEFDYCLEEYLDLIREFKFNEKHLKIVNDNMDIEIFFVEKTGSITQIMIDSCQKYDVSGNNIDGFIVTVFK